MNFSNIDTRNLWLELHDIYKQPNILESFRTWEKKLPAFNGCVCHNHYLLFKLRNAIDFNNKENFFNWTVNLHNDVNKRLGKPIMSLEDAKKLYF